MENNVCFDKAKAIQFLIRSPRYNSSWEYASADLNISILEVYKWILKGKKDFENNVKSELSDFYFVLNYISPDKVENFIAESKSLFG